MATVNLFPYGNAHESQEPSGGWTFRCQHGDSECHYNLIDACAIHYQETNTFPNTFGFVNCIEINDMNEHYQPDNNFDLVATKCANENKIQNIDQVLSCVAGPLGNQLMH